jgi:regulator of nucleoside diphosphate kinase
MNAQQIGGHFVVYYEVSFALRLCVLAERFSYFIFFIRPCRVLFRFPAYVVLWADFGGFNMARQIIITEKDRVRLQEIVSDILLTEVDGVDHVRALDAEMQRAKVVPSGKVPSDVITMHSKVILSFDGGDDEEYTLVYPDEANLAENKLSVLSPVGTAILGYRAGDLVNLEVPEGIVTICVKSVVYQPEAAGDDA